MSTAQKGYLLSGIPLIAFLGLILSRAVKKDKNPHHDISTNSMQLGNLTFEPNKKLISIGEKIIELTGKECKLLLIFANSPNEIIERSRLQKEIWEDEGVIVGRSLDMFISKLGKKLTLDPSIQLANIHGKGYILKIEE